MSIKIQGKIERRDIGMGAWAIISEDGTTYEILRGADKQLLQAGQTVNVTGTIRKDVMTTAMIGPVLEVESFEIVE
ncbi:hypothetical protein [Calothrix sp. NIES-3974]|uniref:hypothetical protein n=1 Tax=Calothrix sp. NIES-3974 TaxID=2005462 RepID=UPI000B617A71|nr:hypothetical protein [Calothrix sp. NIES-3974]BAZ04076.1 hypothetical protein NIES3974_07060 [Calothrix sp. NIES-3974]